jgi:hypothetical protein
MVIYSKEEKTLIIPEGLGYEAEQQYNKGYDNGYNKGFKDGSEAHDVEISMDYYLYGRGYPVEHRTAFFYLGNFHSVVMNGFEFYDDQWWDVIVAGVFYHKHYIRALVSSTKLPDELTFTYFCESSTGQDFPLPTVADFDNLVIDGKNYTFDDVSYESAGGTDTYYLWKCTVTCHLTEEDEQNDNNEE